MAPLSGSRFCFAHDPTAATARRSAASRGGQRTRTVRAAAPVAVKTIADLQGHLAVVLADVLARDNTDRRAQAAARLIEVGRRLLESSEMHERLRQLEEQVALIAQRERR